MRRLVVSACALRFFDTFLLIIPFYTVMFAERGLSPAQIGMALFAWSATALLLEVPCGVLADRTSRRVLLAVAQSLRAAGFGVWLVWPGFEGYVIGLVLWGAKSATMSGAFEAVVYDALKADGRERLYGRVMGAAQAARYIAMTTASLAAAAAASLGYEALIFASIASTVAGIAAAFALPEAPRTISTARASYFGHLRRGATDTVSLPGVPALLAFIAGGQAVASACADYWQIFGREVGLAKPAIALFIAAWGATEAVASLLAHRLGGPKLAHLALWLIVAGVVLIGAVAAYVPAAVMLVRVYAGVFRMVDINADATFQHAIRPETRATVGSFKGFVMQSLTDGLMLSFGFLAEAASYRASFLGAGVLVTTLGMAFSLWMWRTRRSAIGADR